MSQCGQVAGEAPAAAVVLPVRRRRLVKINVLAVEEAEEHRMSVVGQQGLGSGMPNLSTRGRDQRRPWPSDNNTQFKPITL